MSPPRDDSHLLLRAVADELVRCGMTDAVTSPGSRSTPIVLALARERACAAYSHVDERAAAFFALGLAKASRRPVALACTSGTAAAEYLPAVIEAHEAGVPLLVLTADRPPELRDLAPGRRSTRSSCTATAVRWYVDLGIHEASTASVRWARALACRAVWTARGATGGRGRCRSTCPCASRWCPRARWATTRRRGGRRWRTMAGASDAAARVERGDAQRGGGRPASAWSSSPAVQSATPACPM